MAISWRVGSGGLLSAGLDDALGMLPITLRLAKLKESKPSIDAMLLVGFWRRRCNRSN